MKLYTSGIMSIVATIAALVVHVERSQNFHTHNPWLFYVGQLVLLFVFLGIAILTLYKWENNCKINRLRFFISLFVCAMIYAISYTNSKYSFALILACGILEAYSIRKRAGLVK